MNDLQKAKMISHLEQLPAQEGFRLNWEGELFQVCWIGTEEPELFVNRSVPIHHWSKEKLEEFGHISDLTSEWYGHVDCGEVRDEQWVIGYMDRVYAELEKQNEGRSK